jgi:hypothetical protein
VLIGTIVVAVGERWVRYWYPVAPELPTNVTGVLLADLRVLDCVTAMPTR